MKHVIDSNLRNLKVLKKVCWKGFHLFVYYIFIYIMIFFTGQSSRSPRKKEIERKQSLDIERWLKNKFREGCLSMKEGFEERDAKNNGLVSITVVTLGFFIT